MKVTVVGTSCSHFKRKNTSFVIDDDIIIDMPNGSFKDIISILNIFKVHSVFITHFHTDHFSDLHNLTTQALRHPDRFMPGKLRVYGPKGILNRLIETNKLFDGDEQECSLEESDRLIDFIELHDGMTFQEGKYKVTAYKMSHGGAETYGLVFEDKFGGVGFSADTCMCENLEKIVENSKYAFVEMCRTSVGDRHLSIDEFEGLEKKYGNTKLFPVHTSDECQQYAEEHGMNYLHDGQVLNFDE